MDGKGGVVNEGMADKVRQEGGEQREEKQRQSEECKGEERRLSTIVQITSRVPQNVHSNYQQRTPGPHQSVFSRLIAKV